MGIDKGRVCSEPVDAEQVTARKGQTVYPPPFATLVQGRIKRKLGDLFGLTNFGVNLTQLEPGAVSALFHRHSAQDEFIYVLEGTPTLRVGDRECVLHPGDCMGFAAGTGPAHQLVNRSDNLVSYLEIGDRSSNDQAEYPDDDIRADLGPDGSWVFTHKDGRPY